MKLQNQLKKLLKPVCSQLKNIQRLFNKKNINVVVLLLVILVVLYFLHKNYLSEGFNLFEGFKKDIDVNKSIKGGRIYSPKEGKFFKAKLSLLKNGDLKVEGCVLFICDGEEWKPLIVTINPDGSHTAVLKNAPEG